MKLAVSNIAWPGEPDVDAAAIALLVSNGIRGLEVAPTRVWPEWQGMEPASIRDFRRRIESAGLAISSLQSILFQKPELKLFGSDADRAAMHDHLRLCADLAAGLGAHCLVFGAPKNRDRGTLSEAEAFTIARDFFARASEYYAERGVCLGFEANPIDYQCNFAFESATAARLVRAVDSPGFRLHLDSACLFLAGENAVDAIEQNRDILAHFHVSEPHLGAFATPAAPHSAIAGALARIHYSAWCALEMRAATPPLPALESAVRFVLNTYANGK